MLKLTTLALTLLLAGSVRADDGAWNQFRGPRGDGTSLAKNLPVEFAEDSKDLVWKTPVAGRAWSSPVIWGEQLWMTNAPEIENPEGVTALKAFTEDVPPRKDPISLSAVCLDLKTGRKLHDLKVFDVYKLQFTHSTNSYASPTPYIEEGRLYVHFGAYGTACIDTATGKKLWERRDIECNHWRGAGSSPVAYGDLLFLSFDGFDKQFVIALNKHTGKTVWQKDRNINYGTDNGDAKKAYSTPQMITVTGRDLLVSPSASATIAYAPASGDVVWTLYHGGMNAAARPLYGNGLVYINAGDGPDALVAIRPNGSGDISKTNVAWRTGQKTPKRPSQILVGKDYFMMNDEGVCSCLDAVTGENIWTKRISGRYWASPLYADGNIYFFSQGGEIPVIKASREFEVVAESKLDGSFNASPAVAGNALILRTGSDVYCFRKGG